MKKEKIGILTTFYRWDSAFSLTTVVEQQLKMLLKYGYEPVLFVLDIFKDNDKVPAGVEVRNVIPQLTLEPYGVGDLSKLDSDVSKACLAMEKYMLDIDVCLTHDIIFINSYLPYNVAMRKAIEGLLGNVKWLHWMHSAPSIRPNMDGSPYDNLYTLPKNSKLVYMNYTDVVRAAEMYGIMPKDVRTIFNPMDIRELYDLQPLVRKMIDDYDLLSADIIVNYPLSTTRMNDNGKQLSKVIWIVGYLKKAGLSVRLVIPNAHANGEREKQAIRDMIDFANGNGLNQNEVIFTSLQDVPNNEQGVNHQVVRDLFTLSNVFIFPSVSENCPLVLLEAMAAKNLLVLNYSFPAMRDFGGKDALYFRFGSLVDNPQYPLGLDKYMQDVATLIISELSQNKSLLAHTRLRQRFNVDWIFKRQLEPAIMELLNLN